MINAVIEKAKWHNRLDEAYGLLCLSISPNLIFNIDGFTTPNQVWTQLEFLFGVEDELRTHRLEIELFSLSPINFQSIKGFFTTFKSLVLILKKCGIDKEYDQLILSILSKLGPDYSVFVSTFHATRLVVPKWKMPSLNSFLDSLTKEQDKLIHMGVFNS